MTASERRNAILEVLCLRRFETVSNLAFEFDVTDRTIRNLMRFLAVWTMSVCKKQFRNCYPHSKAFLIACLLKGKRYRR